MDITPKDQAETKALGYGQRISVAIGIIVAMGSGLLAAFGDVKWISDNLPLLGTGVGALVTGGLTSYIAVRRMRIDRNTVTKATLLLLLLFPVLILTGCAVISGKAGESHYVGLAFGEKASSTLAGLNITETQTQKGQILVERGVGIDKAGSSGEADMGKILGNLLLLGLQSQGIPVKPQASEASPGSSDTAPSDTSSDTYIINSYTGTPGPAGEGVYGNSSCSRCRAYQAAHPDTQLINLAEPDNRTAMWAALKRLGYTGTVVSLPVLITADAYTLQAK